MIRLISFYKFLIVICCFILLYSLGSLWNNSMSLSARQRSKKILSMGNRTDLYRKSFKNRVMGLVDKRFSSLLPLEIDKKLIRIGYRGDLYDFLISKYLYSLILVVLGICLSPITINITIVSIIFSVFTYFQPDIEIEKKYKKLNNNILKEFPRFARTLRYSPHNNIVDTIDDYIAVSKGPLYYDLKVLHAKLESGVGEREALNDFAQRININAITNYIMVVITAIETTKDNVDTLYAIQEEKIRQMNLNNIKDEMNKRPEILERINGVVIYSIMALNGLAILLSFYYDFVKKI